MTASFHITSLDCRRVVTVEYCTTINVNMIHLYWNTFNLKTNTTNRAIKWYHWAQQRNKNDQNDPRAASVSYFSSVHPVMRWFVALNAHVDVSACRRRCWSRCANVLIISGFQIRAPRVDRWSLQMLQNPLLIRKKKSMTIVNLYL